MRFQSGECGELVRDIRYFDLNYFLLSSVDIGEEIEKRLNILKSKTKQFYIVTDLYITMNSTND